MSQILHAMVAEYRAGLEAELALLRQLDALSIRHHQATTASDFDTMRAVHDQRNAVMTHLVSVEHELKPLRAELAGQKARLQHDAAFAAVAALHAQAADMVDRIIASDQQSMQALEQAEHARRAAAVAMEKGETTLQAYRRVIAPVTSNPALVDRHG